MSKDHDHADCEFCTRRSLAQALEAAGLSADPDDWRDSQGLGQAVMEKLRGKA